MVVGQDRTAGAFVTVGDLRIAREAFAVAEQLGVGVVTVVDSPGAEVSADAERAGMASAIAATLAAGTRLTVPTTALLLGDGSGAASIALCGADRIVATDTAWLSALPPRGAAALVHGDPDRVEEIAIVQRIAAEDMFADGLLDGIARAGGTERAAGASDGSPSDLLADAVLELCVGAVRASALATAGG